MPEDEPVKEPFAGPGIRAARPGLGGPGAPGAGRGLARPVPGPTVRRAARKRCPAGLAGGTRPRLRGGLDRGAPRRVCRRTR